MRILVIDSITNDRLAVERELRSRFPQAAIQPVGHPEEWSLALEAGECALVVADDLLEWADGASIARSVQQRWPGCPIIFFSSGRAPASAAEARAVGAREWLAKAPENVSALVAAAGSALVEVLWQGRTSTAEGGWQEAVGQAVAGGADRWRAMVETSQATLLLMDAACGIEYVSPSVTEILGFLPEEMQGQDAFGFVHPEDLSQVQGLFGKLLAKPGSSVPILARVRRKDGDWAVLEATGTNLLANPTVRAVVVSARDVTRSKRLERVLRQVGEGVGMALGSDFFEHLVRQLAQTLAVDFAFVSERLATAAPRMRTVAVFGDGQALRGFEYVLEGTPCDDLLRRRFVCHARDVQKVYPRAAFLREWGVESFQGVPLCDSRQNAIGALVVMSRKPQRQIKFIRSVLQVFAIRAGAELERKQAEARVRRSQASLAEAQRVARLGNWDWNIVTGELEWSDEVYRMFGLTVQQFGATYEAFLQCVHPDDRAFVKAEVDAALRRIRPYSIDHRIVLPDGTERVVHEQAEVTFDESGRPVRMIGTVLDITERKQTEETLLKLSRATDQTADHIVVTDRKGVIEYVNAAFLRQTGFRREEVIGHTPRILKSGRHPPAFYADLWTTILDGQVFRGVLCNRKKNGELFYEEKTITPIKDAQGDITHFIATGRDITERFAMQEQLRESEARYRQLVENAMDMIFTCDAAGRLTSLNRAGEQITGYLCEEASRLTLAELAIPECRELAGRIVAQVLADEDPGVQELVLTTKDHRRVVVEVSVRPLLREGRPAGFQAIARDITQRKRLEEQLRQSQKMEAIGRLAGGVAHDFNNVLTAIFGFTEMLLERFGHEPAARSDLEEIRGAADRAAKLTRQLLAFSRHQVVSASLIDLNELVLGMVRLLRRLIGEDIILVTSLAAQLARIKADPAQLDQVIMNLVINARDSMASGGRIEVRTLGVSAVEADARQGLGEVPGDFVLLEVSDTGCGIGPEVIEHIFEPFFTTKEQGRGTGLGLATVYGIVRQSGGQIRVHSVPGQGATFRLYFPAARGETDTQPPAPAPAELPRGQETILLVEDDAALRALAASVLRTRGYQVFPCADATEAIGVAEKLSPGRLQLLVTDVVLPGLCGFDLAQRLQEIHPTLRVLYISGYAETAASRRALAAGHCQLLLKPFLPNDLERSVRLVLDL
jgi:PAS domain S-box-containing protein